jgi:regulator of protease activity HflC (stomatin/prohibitin superfamily)
MDGFLIFVAAVAVLALFIILFGVSLVPQGWEYTLVRFGKYIRTLKPGFNLIIPVIDRVGEKVSMMETVLDVPAQDVITKDNATVTADGVLFFQIIDAPKAVYQVRDLQRAMANLALTNIRTVIGAMDLDEVLSKRDEINDRLLRVVDQATDPWGVKVTRIEIKDLSPPADINEAMARQMKAERLKRAEILQAEGQKQATILRAEGDKQSMVLEAEGRREAAFRDAEAREREAEAEAAATEMVSTAIARGDVQAINYFIAQKYVGALTELAKAPNQKVILMPLETSAVIASIAGIAELTKGVLKERD